MTSTLLRLRTQFTYNIVGPLANCIHAPTDCFAVFNPYLKLDARGITPFIPSIIRGDLVRLLDNDNGTSPTPQDSVSLSKALTNQLSTFL